MESWRHGMPSVLNSTQEHVGTMVDLSNCRTLGLEDYSIIPVILTSSYCFISLQLSLLPSIYHICCLKIIENFMGEKPQCHASIPHVVLRLWVV
jgi:hypothetical protein